jgi:hypothetical protein
MNRLQKRNERRAVRLFAGMLIATAVLAVLIVVGAFAFRFATHDMALNAHAEKATVCVGDDQCYRVRKRPRPTA